MRMTNQQTQSVKDSKNALVLSFLTEQCKDRLIYTCNELLSKLSPTEDNNNFFKEIDTLEFSFVTNRTKSKSPNLYDAIRYVIGKDSLFISITDNFRNNVGESINHKMPIIDTDLNYKGLAIAENILEESLEHRIRVSQLNQYFNYLSTIVVESIISEDIND